MLHRVFPLEKNKLPSNENLKISPEFLEHCILHLQKEGYEFISLDRLYEILQYSEKVKKKIVFTLDDGYKDNFTYAYPIFKKYKIPFTIYITTSFPDKKSILWWYTLEDLILENDKIYLSSGSVFKCQSRDEKILVFKQIRELILSLPQVDILENLKELFKNYKVNWQNGYENLTMNWEHIQELSQDELCTIGGHTINHLSLHQLSDKEVREEILDANKLLQGKIGKKIEHFAYPFGSKDTTQQREYDIIKELKFKTATTTRSGKICLKHKDYMDCLPRVHLADNFNLKKFKKIKIWIEENH